MKTRIHINKHKIKSNKKNNQNEPVITVKNYKSNQYGHEVIVSGPCKIIYSPNKPLGCGAEVWIETESTVKVIKHANNRKTSRQCNERTCI